MLEWLSQHFDTVGILIVGIALVYQRWSSGSSGLRKEINEEYKERNKQLEDKVKECLDKIHATDIVVAELRGIINEKDKHIDSLTKILQGRNPEMMELLKEIKTSNQNIQDFMKTIYQVLNDELKYQTEILEQSKEREEKIDRASAEHTGEPTRVPVKPITS